MEKMKLHAYQKRVVEFCKTSKHIILSVGCGLGKTASVLHYIKETNPETVIIIAPKNVALTVWKQEAEKWELSDIHNKMVIVDGAPKQRKEKLQDQSTPYKIIGRDILKDIENRSCDLLVLDELTSFKSVDAKRSKFAQSIRRKQTIGLTGTFLANGAIDIYGQAKSVGLFSDERQNFWAWRATFFRNVMQGSKMAWEKWVLRVPLEEVLKPIQKNIFTLTSEDWLDIPKVQYIKHDIKLSKQEQTEYMRLNSMLHVNLDDVTISIKEQAKFAKLQTLCNGFVYDTKTSEAFRSKYSTKIDAVVEFIERCVSEGESVLLAFAFREEAIWIAEKLKKKGITYASSNSKDFVRRFENKEFDVLMGNAAAIGHGINLQHASRMMVWSSITYNYELWEQMNARLIRTGQTRGVQIHVFSALDTIEQGQYKALMKKDAEQKKFLQLTK